MPLALATAAGDLLGFVPQVPMMMMNDYDDDGFDTMNLFEFIIDSISSQITNGPLI